MLTPELQDPFSLTGAIFCNPCEPDTGPARIYPRCAGTRGIELQGQNMSFLFGSQLIQGIFQGITATNRIRLEDVLRKIRDGQQPVAVPWYVLLAYCTAHHC